MRHGVGISSMLDLRYQLMQAIRKYYFEVDKSPLVKRMETILSNFLVRIAQSRLTNFQTELVALHYAKSKKKSSGSSSTSV